MSTSVHVDATVEDAAGTRLLADSLAPRECLLPSKGIHDEHATIVVAVLKILRSTSRQPAARAASMMAASQ